MNAEPQIIRELPYIPYPYKGKTMKLKRVECLCHCGNVFTAFLNNINSGMTKSCGCGKKKMNSKYADLRKYINSPTHSSWSNMLQRCYNEKNSSFKYYGGRGITVEESWKDFRNFLADMGERAEGTTLDRINTNGNYCKENCRWTDNLTQKRNRRKTRWFTNNGETLPITIASERAGLSAGTALYRLKAGWLKENLFKPAHYTEHQETEYAELFRKGIQHVPDDYFETYFSNN